uniref:Uncharacterized protein n=1 Tax=viral metagenome TaxID=1070528 RepID=A0A6C0LK35_9ZZZZ
MVVGAAAYPRGKRVVSSVSPYHHREAGAERTMKFPDHSWYGYTPFLYTPYAVSSLAVEAVLADAPTTEDVPARIALKDVQDRIAS